MTKFQKRYWLMAVCAMLLTLSLQNCEADDGWVTTTVAGCTVRARAYHDQTFQPGSSRYDIEITNKPAFSQWRYTVDAVKPTYRLRITHSEGRYAGESFIGKKTAQIGITLYGTAELTESATFHDIAIGPPSPPVYFYIPKLKKNIADEGSRYAVLPAALSATTPSGITITLIAQPDPKKQYLFSYMGDPVFVDIETSPNTPLSVLPQSPLYQEYKLPVKISLSVLTPIHMVSYMADNTYHQIALDIPDFESATKIDTLTLSVTQRVDIMAKHLVMTLPVVDDSQPTPSAQVTK